MNLANASSPCATTPRPLRATVIAASLFGAMLVAGCNRAEAPATAPAAPASSAPAGSTAPSSSATPGTPDGARATLPPSEAVAGSKPTEGTAADSKETNPKGDLTKKEESQGMPEALQAGNNHSSPALDTEPKKP